MLYQSVVYMVTIKTVRFSNDAYFTVNGRGEGHICHGGVGRLVHLEKWKHIRLDESIQHKSLGDNMAVVIWLCGNEID